MTRTLTTGYPKDWNINSFFVGYDKFFNEASKIHDELAKHAPNYPPYNVKKIDENKYVIELAVAGFCRSDIEIEFVEDKLIVRGASKHDDSNDYLFKGISNRSFTRAFALSDSIEIKGAEMLNGMLQIILERIIPEHKKPKKIEIKDPSVVAATDKQLLTEEK